MASANGNRIKELRTAKGWTQWDLAVESGVRETTLRRIEAGQSPHLRNAQALARALGVTVTELFPEQQEASA